MNGSVTLIEDESLSDLQNKINKRIKNARYRNNGVQLTQYTDSKGVVIHVATLIFDNNVYNKESYY